jgi:nucleoside-diphosphate-sugar epimerase
MLRDEKILLTGPAGQIAFPIAEYLSADNEVWGIARFGDSLSRERVDALDVTTRACDIGKDDFRSLPTDFTYLLHLAAYQGPGTNYDYAITVNAEGAGLLMQHCRNAKAVLVMSTSSVYRPHHDPMHAFLEGDPVGGGTSPWAPTYAVSKIAQEAVVRQNARSLGLPSVIARMNASYGPNGGLPTLHLAALLGGDPIVARWDPSPYTPIFQQDINEQIEPLLAAASVPATVVNWGGDEIVTIQQWVAYLSEMTGLPAEVAVTESAGSHRGMVSDPTKRLGLTGPCRVDWREGLRRVLEAGSPSPSPSPGPTGRAPARRR